MTTPFQSIRAQWYNRDDLHPAEGDDAAALREKLKTASTHVMYLLGFIEGSRLRLGVPAGPTLMEAARALRDVIETVEGTAAAGDLVRELVTAAAFLETLAKEG